MAGEYKDIIASNIKSLFAFANESTSALWYRLATFASNLMDIISIEIRNTESIISDSALNHRVMNQSYYVDIALQYQEGDNLIEIDKVLHKLGYAEINPDKQIIKQAVVSLQDNFITINVATTDSSENLIPLSSSQLSSFKSYFENFMAFGLPVNIKSEEADTITIEQHDNLISYDAALSLDSVKQDIANKLDEIQKNVILGSTYYINDIVSQLMEIDGIVNVYIPEVKVTPSGESGKKVSNKIPLKSGYFNFASNSENAFNYEAV